MAKKTPNDLVREAESLITVGRAGEAPARLTQAIRLAGAHPAVAKIRTRLGTVLLHLGRIDDAIEVFEQAVKGDSAPGCRLGLVQSYVFAGRREDGARELMPLLGPPIKDPGLDSKVARLLHDLGKGDEAIARLETWIDQGRADRAVAEVFGQLAIREGRADEAISLLIPHTEDDRIPAPVRGPSLFTLARLLESVGRFDEAWDSASKANALTARPFDADAHDRKIDTRLERFTVDSIRGIAQDDGAGERAVLIMGLPRSGTTLIERLLGGHQDIAVGGELRALHDAVGAIPGTKPEEETPPLNRVRGGALTKARKAYLTALDSVSVSSPLVTDKQPHNYQHLGMVPALIPMAKVIRCKRDLRDVAVSCFFRGFATGNAFASGLDGIARFFKAYQRLMRHWEAVLPEAWPGGVMASASYEDVALNPESETARLLSKIGLNDADPLISIEQLDVHSKTLEPDQQGASVYGSSVGRWTHYEAKLGPFIEAMGGDLEG